MMCDNTSYGNSLSGDFHIQNDLGKSSLDVACTGGTLPYSGEPLRRQILDNHMKYKKSRTAKNGSGLKFGAP